MKCFKLSKLEKIFIALIVITSGTLVSRELSIPMYFLTAVFFVMVATKEIDFRRISRTIIPIGIIGVLIIAQYFVIDDSTVLFGTFLKVDMIFLMMFIYTNNNVEKNIVRYSFFIRTILIFSIISNALFVAIFIGIPVPSFVSNLGINSVFYLEQFFVGTNYGLMGYRNSGIFWEPGMYQIYLNLMLIYFLYSGDYRGNKKIFLVIYAIVSVLSTGSVTGYILCFLVMALYALNNSTRLPVKILIAVLTILMLFIAFPYLESMINTKMTIGNSYTHRLSDISTGWEFFMKSPIWGYGINSTAYQSFYNNIYGMERGNTNGLISVFIQFGLIGAFLYFYHVVGLIKLLKSQYTSAIIMPMIMWVVLSLSTEPISTHTSVFFLLGLGMSYSRTKRLDISNLENNQNG